MIGVYLNHEGSCRLLAKLLRFRRSAVGASCAPTSPQSNRPQAGHSGQVSPIEPSTSVISATASSEETPREGSERAMGMARSCIQPCSSHSRMVPASRSTEVASRAGPGIVGPLLEHQLRARVTPRACRRALRGPNQTSNRRGPSTRACRRSSMRAASIAAVPSSSPAVLSEYLRPGLPPCRSGGTGLPGRVRWRLFDLAGLTLVNCHRATGRRHALARPGILPFPRARSEY